MNTIKPINLPPQIFNLKGWIQLTGPNELQHIFDETLIRCGFKVLNFSSHQFPLNGYTALWLLAESHLAVHTFSSSGWTYIELSSCNKDKAMHFISFCQQVKYTIRWEHGVEELNCGAIFNVFYKEKQ